MPGTFHLLAQKALSHNGYSRYTSTFEHALTQSAARVQHYATQSSTTWVSNTFRNPCHRSAFQAPCSRQSAAR